MMMDPWVDSAAVAVEAMVHPEVEAVEALAGVVKVAVEATNTEPNTLITSQFLQKRFFPVTSCYYPAQVLIAFHLVVKFKPPPLTIMPPCC